MDPSEFAGRAREFLAARLERNLLATVLDNVLRSDRRSRSLSTAGGAAATHPAPMFALGSDPVTGETAAAALRVPPQPMLAAGFDDPADAVELIERWLTRDPGLSGLAGEPDTARQLAQAWRTATGGASDCAFHEAMHSLQTVLDPPRPTAGGLRRANDRDRELLLAWTIAFGAETGFALPGRAAAVAAVDRRLAAGQWFIWDDERPVSGLAHHVRVAGAVRIGPVYTPPEFRDRGYASAAVAALSRRLLAGGAERCILFTDLANPTSNRIYASVGFVRFADWEQHRLLR